MGWIAPRKAAQPDLQGPLVCSAVLFGQRAGMWFRRGVRSKQLSRRLQSQHACCDQIQGRICGVGENNYKMYRSPIRTENEKGEDFVSSVQQLLYLVGSEPVATRYGAESW